MRAQLDLLAARGDRQRRPRSAERLVPMLIGALRGRGWVAGAVLGRELGVDLRTLRAAAHASGGAVIGGNRGYALVAETPVSEVREVIARHLSQSREQPERAMEIERAFHGCSGGAA